MTVPPIERIRKRFPNFSPSPLLNRNSGLKGAIPTVWDANWQIYTDLSKDQIAAFVAMPEWKDFVQSFNVWQRSGKTASPPSLTVPAVASKVIRNNINGG